MAANRRYSYDIGIVCGEERLQWTIDFMQKMEKRGLKCYYFLRNSEPGLPIADNWWNGMRSCRKVLLLMTPEWDTDEWNVYATQVIQVLSPAGRERKLIPVKCHIDVQVPICAAALEPLDLTSDLGRQYFWRRLWLSLGIPTPANNTAAHGHAADALPDMMDQEDMGEDMYNSMGRSRAGDMYNNSLGRPSAAGMQTMSAPAQSGAAQYTLEQVIMAVLMAIIVCFTIGGLPAPHK